MSYDPQSPSDRRDQEPDNACPYCGALDTSPNVEAFETFGDVMCEECAELRFAGLAEDALDTIDPRDADWSREGIFVHHNCAGCDSGKRPCREGNPNRCDWPRARND